MITARAAATFEPVGRSVATARAFVRDTLQGWGCADIVDDAVVLTSELVTNAVVHAGTAADVLCLRNDDGVRISVADRYPEREIPLQNAGQVVVHPDREGGRGLLLCGALATRWGVEYTAAQKHVWFQLDLPERPAGTRSAGPALPVAALPVAETRVRVAVIQIDRGGCISFWNEDAQDLFAYDPEQVIGKPLTDFAAWPHTPGTGTGIVEALQLSRWEGSYGIRGSDGRVVPVYASHLRVRDADGEASTVCLLVRDHERAILQSPQRTPAPDAASQAGPSEGRLADPFEVFIGSPAPDDLDGLLQRTVERARDMLDGDAAYLLLATDDETELEVRASTGLPSARQRFARVPVEAGSGRYGSARMPAVHEDLTAVPGAVPLLSGTGMRSVVTVPLKVEGRLTGSLGVAAEGAGRYTNEEALRLQFAADRIALAVERARLTELEKLRRGSLSFLVEASDLLAGTLDRDQTLALMAQMTVPTLATWCAVYTVADQTSEPELSYVLHEDEDRIDGLKTLLMKVDPPEPVPTPGARVWTAPGDAAHDAALRTSMRSLGLGNAARPSTGPGATLATASAVGGETVVLPLVARNRVIGMLTLGKPTEEHFRQEILELAEDLSRRAALALDNARLYSERTAISQSLQRSLLPPEQPAIPGVEVEVIYRAAGEGNEVGGDFYDIFPIRDGAYGFAIGDVCGTGPEAAAVTGLARHALRLLAREGFGGPAVLERLNAAILDEGARSRFLTLLYGELWPQADGSAVLKVVCAGHPLPLRLRQDGTVEPAAEPQPLLGVMDDLELYEQNVSLDPGDVLLCVTDGVTERREGTRMLGDDGLTDLLTTCTGLTAGAVAARVLRAVERFAVEPASDDMAILAMRIPEAPAG
ncbi:PAS domain S-box-containing protein [Streptomyces sp. 2224.1]|nr:PAS domain S-box-containing protein [Streptomyces sp. 2321.6]SDR15449.1 PAS domain S-box-containing protein [Streptomyces sp. KS_16]SED67509.1 PAS domain S-box-containing protein [Streptomyces sp. 2133.1]SEE15179.1 PAS domain S-box-containing protein [Streptomyces sp. 2112.3]SEE31969.1 PAS domain S-box-containing protein [Streptomyces sp. 2224.1]